MSEHFTSNTVSTAAWCNKCKKQTQHAVGGDHKIAHCLECATERFSLEPTGPRVTCDFRGCILEAWHDGDHQFAPPAKKQIQWNYDRHCVVCGVPFTVIGADKDYIAHTCGSQECLLHYARHFSFDVPLVCRCPQRPYPHELSVHTELRSESYNPKLKFRWPWSLMLSKREEPSTERKAAA